MTLDGSISLKLLVLFALAIGGTIVTTVVYQDTLKEVEEQNEALRERNAELRERLKATRQELAEERTQTEELKEQLSTRRQDIEKLAAELNRTQNRMNITKTNLVQACRQFVDSGDVNLTAGGSGSHSDG